MQTSSFHFGPHRTPRVIKSLIIVILVCSLLSPILTFFLHHFFHLQGPQDWLPLSRQGFSKGAFWQPLSYFFIHSAGVDVSFSLLISLAFLLFFLWFAGSEVYFRFGLGRFFLLYLGGGVFAGLVTLGFLFLFSSSALLTGSSPAVFSLLAAWALLHPSLDLYFFFFIRVKAKWLIVGILGFSLLTALMQRAYFAFIADSAGIAWGYLCTWFFLKRRFAFFFKKQHRNASKNKIIDIEVLRDEDDAFMDRMLEKMTRP